MSRPAAVNSIFQSTGAGEPGDCSNSGGTALNESRRPRPSNSSDRIPDNAGGGSYFDTSPGLPKSFAATYLGLDRYSNRTMAGRSSAGMGRATDARRNLLTSLLYRNV